MKDVKLIVKEIKSVIDREGLEFLKDHPDKVYDILIKSDSVDKNTALILFTSLKQELPTFMEKAQSEEKIFEHIKSFDFYSESVCALLAKVYAALYSDQNRRSWLDKVFSGVKSFLKKDFKVVWIGFSEWSCDQGYVDCHFNSMITLRVKDEALVYKALKQELKVNSFLSEEKITEIFSKSLTSYLDNEFNDYCLADDYYEPVAEDFEVDYHVEDWCKDNGFEIVSVQGHGDTGGFESNHYSKGIEHYL